MKKLTVIALLIAAGSVHAETISKNAVACTTESKFDEITQAIVTKDQRGMQYMLGNGCIVTNGRYSVSVLDRTWSGKVKVRAYAGEDAIVLWTNMESVN